MNLSKSQITINWSQPFEQPLSVSPFIWNQSDIKAAPTSDLDEVCKVLFGSDLVGRILSRAFELGLDRHQAWTYRDLPESQVSALAQAATIFKRGVRFDHPHDQKRSFLTKSGASTVDFLVTSDCIFAEREVSDLVIVDKNVYDLWRTQLPEDAAVVDVSEAHKNMTAVAEIIKLIPVAAKRMIIVGGGVLGDIAGFAAGLKKLQTIYVPTTLLAMADSSVGGKTGVNAGHWGKNQLGLFYPPVEVRIWAGWLSTLPKKELRSGMSECVKHAMLSGDQELWNRLLKIAKDETWSELRTLLPAIVSVKAQVVERDAFENGERAVLNLGHTLGHALETLSLETDGDAALTHGEAVAVGLCYALQLSKKHAGFVDADRYIAELKDARLVPDLSLNLQKRLGELPRLLAGDKKNIGTNVQWVLMEKFGVVARSEGGGWTIALPLNEVSASNLSCS